MEGKKGSGCYWIWTCCYYTLITAVRVVRSDVAAGEPGPEELAPANEGHSRSIQEKESAEEKLAPVVAGEAVQSTQESQLL